MFDVGRYKKNSTGEYHAGQIRNISVRSGKARGLIFGNSPFFLKLGSNKNDNDPVKP
jgi:hypothetical protein